MTTHANHVSRRTGALLAGVCLAGLGLSAPAAAQDETPGAEQNEAPGAEQNDAPESADSLRQQEAANQRAMPVGKTLPRITLAELTEEEEQVAIQRPIRQGHLQVIYVFSSAGVEDNTWIERALTPDKPGVRSTLEHMQRLAELDTFEGRVIWSAISVPGYPRSSSTLAAGFPDRDQQAQEGLRGERRDDRRDAEEDRRDDQEDREDDQEDRRDDQEDDQEDRRDDQEDRRDDQEDQADNMKDRMKTRLLGEDRRDGQQAESDESRAARAAREPVTREFLRDLKDQTDAEFSFLVDTKNRVVPALGLRRNVVLVVDAKGVIQFAADEHHTMALDHDDKNIADSDYVRRALNELLDGKSKVSSPYGSARVVPGAERSRERR